ncbi:MAG: hypothetical protein JOZ96_22210 [Acidobacteria bacterium]|nr:hypothetical protein [Acidobacteriota bacterium]
MSDNELIEILRESLLSDDAPPLTDEEAEVLLSAPIPVKESPAAVKRARKRFVEKLLSQLHREPVRLVGRGITFGEWIARARDKAHLTSADIGEAVGKDGAFIERLEIGEVLPWKVSPVVTAKIVGLFRIHEDAVRRLMSASLSDYEERHSPFSSPGNLMAAMIDRSDRHSAPRGETSEAPRLNEEIINHLGKLRKLLETQAHDLLSAE